MWSLDLVKWSLDISTPLNKMARESFSGVERERWKTYPVPVPISAIFLAFSTETEG
jgi:hypothetical protein